SDRLDSVFGAYGTAPRVELRRSERPALCRGVAADLRARRWADTAMAPDLYQSASRSLRDRAAGIDRDPGRRRRGGAAGGRRRQRGASGGGGSGGRRRGGGASLGG